MIAVAKIGGHQALVQVGEQIEVDKLHAEVGKTVEFETLLISEEDGTGFQVGTPILEGTKVSAKVLEHGRGKKVLVFKMKPRKRYRRTQGHRQDYTVVEITAIGGAKKAPAKKTETAKAAPKKSAEKPTKKAETVKKTAPAKKPAAKKAPAKKPVAKTKKAE